MKNLTDLHRMAAVVIGLAAATLAQAQVQLQGNLSGVLTQGLYHVVSNLMVPTNQTLVIEAGAVLKFATNTSLTIAGTLVAAGEPSSKIIFTSSAALPVPGGWEGISVFAGGPRTIFDYVEIAFAVNGISIAGNAPQVTVSNADLHHCSVSGVSVRVSSGQFVSSTDVAIVRNRLHHCVYGVFTGASVSTASSRVTPTIDQNEIYSNSFAGISLYASKSPFTTGTPIAGGLVTRNLVRDNATGIWGRANRASCGGFCPVTVVGLIANNIITNNAGQGIELLGGGSVSANIINNTIVANGAEGVFHDLSFSGLFLNNIVTLNNVGLRSGAAFVPATNQISFNDITANLSANWSNYPAAYGSLTTSNANGTPSDFQNNLSINPQFVAATDYHLQFGSPCINAGTMTAATNDYDGKLRFNPPDLGAFETLLLRFGTPIRTNNATGFRISAQAVREFRIESSTNLVTWTNIAVLTNLTGSLDFIDPSAGGTDRKFYRLSPP